MARIVMNYVHDNAMSVNLYKSLNFQFSEGLGELFETGQGLEHNFSSVNYRTEQFLTETYQVHSPLCD